MVLSADNNFYRNGICTIAAPSLLKLNSNAARTYQVLGAGYTLVNALTDTKAGIKHLIPFKTHQRVDLGLLAGMSLLSLVSYIRKDKKALGFHLGFLALAVTNYLLTDYDQTS
ncbi:MAG: hypothetical protein EOO10_09640 [Chitinophagaceae bacterium]|nr:MAG: hypothetical protein EOO10_09640 [Chitinophagaceae bacterium]